MYAKCPPLTRSVEFTVKVRLAISGPNILTSFCDNKKRILKIRRYRKDLIML